MKAKEVKTLGEHRKVNAELTVARTDPIASAELPDTKLKKLRKVSCTSFATSKILKRSLFFRMKVKLRKETPVY